MNLIEFTDIEEAKVVTTANAVTLITTPKIEGQKSEHVVVVNGAGFKVKEDEFKKVRRLMEDSNHPLVLNSNPVSVGLSEL